MKAEDVSAGGGSSASLGREFFPSGLRVLAVDDDPVCLRLIGHLLRRCQYQVTVTNHALEALKMLREKRNEFDLVISDVNMPDMDGFKLLEHVEFEMDIPVIMLSAHSDKELVYKGVTHGAVDYLLKPVRIEELKNIWQHVVRKKKTGGKRSDSSSLTNKVERDGNGVVVGGVGSSESSDANGRSSRKRKDQDDEEGEEEDEDSDGRGENEEGGNQKKARVVWSVDLHKKFVHAVNQLGYDKAVPKKILDLMNVDGLTRENVASHLQKYRLYLRRMSCDKAMGIPYGSKDGSSYPGIASSIDGFDEFRSLTTPGRLSTYQPGGLLGRLNSSSGLTLRGIASSGLLQPTNSQAFLNSSITTLGQQVQQPSLLSTAQTPGRFSLSQCKPSFGLVPSIGGVTSTSGNSMLLPNSHHTRGTFGAQPAALGMPSLNRDSFDVGIQHGPLSPNLLDSSRCNGSWDNAIQLPKFPSNPLGEQFGHEPSLPVRDCGPSSSSQIANIDFSSASLGPPPAAAEMTGQVGLIGNAIEGFSNPGLTNSFGGMNSMDSLDQVSFDHGMDQGRSFDGSSSAAGQLSDGVSPSGFEVDKSQNGFIVDSSSFDPLDDMVAAMLKREQNEGLIIDGDFGLDAYQIGSCI
ncbi:unnamed protein product [Linum tenue]|uniref:Two-component response regulator n=1 Tax=Linum tenue TaxID=586396 RepID=A0AAV0IBQ5_9ROSI|nr:unnamed protein product [Linum tenue]